MIEDKQDKQNTRVVVAMSGGVDSSVVAALLKKEGYDVIGMMQRLWTENNQPQNRCCTSDAIEDAKEIATLLDFPFYVRDYKNIFKNTIVDYFTQTYVQGMTPSPCLICNQKVRFGDLLYEAKTLGAKYLATGHYARVQMNSFGEYELLTGMDPDKDQSYMLHRLNQNQLSHALFPLGNYTKSEVRTLAKKFKLPVFNKQDSQDLCFLGEDGHQGFLKRHVSHTLKRGLIKTVQGEVVGEHQGLALYTVGQRRGLHISYSYPLYVIALNTKENTLIVGAKKELEKDELYANQVNFINQSIPQKPIPILAKIRYKSIYHPATLKYLEKNRIHIQFKQPVSGVTPGQGVVFYHEDKVLGGGMIEK